MAMLSRKKCFVRKVRSPVFFGKLSGGLTRLETVRGEGNLAALKALLGGVAFAPPRRRRPSSAGERAGPAGNLPICTVRGQLWSAAMVDPTQVQSDSPVCFTRGWGCHHVCQASCVTNSTLKAVYRFWKLIMTPAAAPLSATGFPSSSDHTREGATTPAAGGGSL